MDNLSLSLRQRKLLHYLQQKTGDYTTGNELASYLNVSARTIRNDITELTELLDGTGIHILAKRSSGYLLDVEDESVLNKITQSKNSFLSRDERVRHIAFRLCMSDTPVNLYDLEDEMFISRTTLEHDLHALRKSYILPEPHIGFYRHRNHISFENNERKRRIILNHLFANNWNYNARGNSFFQYQYMDERIVNIIINEVNYYMTKYNIVMEDVNMVTLDLAIAIMYYRVSSGHELQEMTEHTYRDSMSVLAAEELLDSLETKLSCKFSGIERGDICLLVSCSRLLDAGQLNFTSVSNYFDHDIISLADSYIRLVQETWRIDFSADEDFYITLLQFLRYLSLPVHYFNSISSQYDFTRKQFLVEFEIAFAFQPLAQEFYGFYLDYTELLYLTFCISGAMAYRNRRLPRLKTVIMCHLNLPAAWELKHHIISKFNDFIDILALPPVYLKDTYDFSKIDLIVTTANKEITAESQCQTLVISPFFTIQDQKNMEQCIQRIQLERLYKASFPSLHQLLSEGFWHEEIDSDDYISVIELLANDFIRQGYVTPEYLTDVLRRESILTFISQPSIVFMYSLVPSSKTCLSIATLKHRIRRDSYKIRTVILAAIRPEDATIVFQLIEDLHSDRFDPNDTRFIKAKEEFIAFFDNLEN